MVKRLAGISGLTARRMADFLWPPQCLACREEVSQPRSLCPDCWGSVRFLEPPLCRQCGYPFEFDAGEALCAACLADPPAFHHARAVMAYGEVPKTLIGALKYGDRQEGAPAFARWLRRAGAELVEQSDVILPVPLHRRKLFQRRFNQAALLALGLARLSGKPVILDALARTRHTDSQAGLGRKGRLDNVKGAFTVPEGQRHRLAGRRVLLVDDVFTTGATAGACARALARAGAGEISVLTLARVVQSRLVR
jgi:ComF family protein